MIAVKIGYEPLHRPNVFQQREREAWAAAVLEKAPYDAKLGIELDPDFCQAKASDEAQKNIGARVVIAS